VLKPAIAANIATRAAVNREGRSPPTHMQTQAACLRFTTVLLCACLFLQRFGLPFGDQSISIVGPLGLALGAWGLLDGSLVLHRQRTALFLGLVGVAVIGMGWHALAPGAYDAAPSQKSMLQFLALTSFATLAFAAPMDERVFFARVNRVLAVIAVCGILQFCAQFLGLHLFRFTGLLPDRWLLEIGYNLEIPVGVGAVVKSNGFFLLEPSIFSQTMALGLIAEMITFRRPVYFALFAGGLALSFSGTGILVLACFFLFAAPSLGGRGLAAITVGAGVLAVAAAVMMLAAPDFAGVMVNRLGELSQPGTSGHLRFITPFWLMGDILARTPSALFTGIGPGVSEKLHLAYEFNVNTPVKVFLEYGLPALVLYLGLFWRGQRGVLQGALFAPLMLLFLFTGGYQQFPPLLFLVLLFVSIARLRAAEP